MVRPISTSPSNLHVFPSCVFLFASLLLVASCSNAGDCEWLTYVRWTLRLYTVETREGELSTLILFTLETPCLGHIMIYIKALQV